MNNLGIDLEGQVVILNCLKEEYPAEKWPFRVSGGFGASPRTIGTALVGEFIPDGEMARQEGYQVARLATADEIADAEARRSRV